MTDFSIGKPSTVPDDDPTDYQYFFDNGSNDSPSTSTACYLAPERFRKSSEQKKKPMDPAMDIFSLGCVIAEV